MSIQTEGGRRIIPIVDERRVLSVRASSWSSLFSCAYQWEGTHLLGMRKPVGLRAHLGTSLHASTAAFDNGRLPGAKPVSVVESAEVFFDRLRNPDEEIDFSQDKLERRDAEAIGAKLHRDYCIDVSPRLKFKSVEQKLSPVDINCGNGMFVRLTGSMDRARVVDTDGGIAIPDIKSGSRVISEGEAVIKGRAPQIGTYQILYEQTEGLQTIGGQVIALHTSSRPSVAVSPLFDAKRVMLGVAETQDAPAVPGLIEHAAAMFRTGLFPPNTSSLLCSPKYCARWDRCTYHE